VALGDHAARARACHHRRLVHRRRRETKQRIEALTDELAAPPYDALSAAELDELTAELEPITATLVATGSQ
jgi:hypothetical protein